jgi:hypothetical protein
MHNLNYIIKQLNDCFTMDMKSKHFQIWNKEFVTNDKKKSMTIKTLNIIPQKHESNYIEWIHAKYTFRLWWCLKVFGKMFYGKSL